MQRRQFIAVSTAAIALPSLARGEKSSVRKFVSGGEPASLDPIATTSYDARSHAFMVYDTLCGQAGVDQGFAAKPQMVAGHTVENDGTSILTRPVSSRHCTPGSSTGTSLCWPICCQC